MKVQGRENASWGFKEVPEGWHMVQFQDGIDYLMDKEGRMSEDKKGNKLLKIPAKIIDDPDLENTNLDTIVSFGTQFGEQKIADILTNCGLYKKFEQNFDADASFFDEGPLSALKSKLPSQCVKFRVEKSKDGKYTNVVEIAKPDANTDAKDTKKGDKADKGEKKAPPAKAPAAEW